MVSLLVAAVVCTATACSASDDERVGPTPTPERVAAVDGPLTILLVNDDGWDAPGITALYDRLSADGHDVTLVAPLENQSGRSMATSSDPLSVTQPAGDVPKYAVDGTPVDALNIGLLGIMKDSPPDLVLSGINTGANVAGNTNYSGTVGAAAAAAEQGLPALAISADVGGPSGDGDYDDGAAIVVDLVDRLADAGFAGLGDDGFINVNVPFETEGRPAPRGLRVVPPALGAPRTVAYAESGPGLWSPVPSYDGRIGADDADASLLADGWTTLTFLPVARGADDGGQQILRDLLGDASKD